MNRHTDTRTHTLHPSRFGTSDDARLRGLHGRPFSGLSDVAAVLHTLFFSFLTLFIYFFIFFPKEYGADSKDDVGKLSNQRREGPVNGILSTRWICATLLYSLLSTGSHPQPLSSGTRAEMTPTRPSMAVVGRYGGGYRYWIFSGEIQTWLTLVEVV